MKRYLKKATLILMLFVFLFSSCSHEVPIVTESNEIKETDTSGGTVYDQLLGDLPNKDYGGREFRIATDTTSLIFSKNSAGIAGKELYLRNRAIEKKYNIKLTLTDESGLPTITERIKSEALAGTDYCDLVILESTQFQTLAASRALLNVRSIPYLDLDGIGVHGDSLAATTLGNYTYGISGNFNYNPENVYAVFFNKALLSQAELPNIYQLVNDNQWDFENFLLYSDELYSKGRINGVKVYGFTSTENNENLVNILWAAGGNRFLGNEYGTRPTLTYYNDTTLNFISQAKDLLYRSYSYKNDPSSAIDLFLSEGSLFLIAPLSCANNIANKGVNWGVVPVPKQDINQANYYSYMSKSSCFVGFAKGSANTEMSANVLNGLFASSIHLTEETFINNYLNMYLNASDDAVMLKKIISTPYYDPIEFFGQMETSVAASTQILLYRVISNEGDFDTLYVQYDKMLNKYLDENL